MVSRPASRRWLALVGLVAVAGVALRTWVYRSALGIPDSDEGVVGLMARHVLDGELSVFFWGQAFGGSHEALVTAPLFAVAGSSWLTLRLVPIVVSGVAALVVWRVGRRTIGEPAAVVAGCAMWVFPPFLVYKLIHQQGFYAGGVLSAGLLLLLGLRAAERASPSRVGVLGLVGGLALWQSAQLVPVVAGVAVWLTWREPRWLRLLPVAALAGVLGALPSILWNLQNGWESLDSPIESTTSYAHRLRLFASPLLPMLLGLRTPFSQEPLGASALVLLVGAILVGAFAYGAYRSRREPASLLYVVVAVFPFVYAAAPQTLFVEEPRYLLVLAPVVVLLLAQLATTYARGVALLVVLVMLSVVTLDRMDARVSSVPLQPPRAPRALAPLFSTLDRLGLDRVYADFWVAYALTFETDERIVAAQSKLERVGPVDGRLLASRHPTIRHRAFERAVERSPRPGFVFFRVSLEQGADRTPGPDASVRVKQLAALTSELEQNGYRRTDIDPFVVYAPPRKGDA